MEVGKLTVFVRKDTGKGESRRLRATGMVPGICYGAKLEQPLSIQLSSKELKSALDPARGRNTVISLRVQDGDRPTAELTAMLWEYQIHSVRRTVTHVDLISIDPEKAIEVDVPLSMIGKAVGTVEGGQIHVERHTLPVRCRPADIPTQIEVDVTPLKIGDAFHVKDLVLPPGVVAAVPETFTVVTCAAPKVEKEATETAVAAEGAVAAAPAEGAAAPAAAGAKAGDKKAGGKAKGEGGGDEKKK